MRDTPRARAAYGRYDRRRRSLPPLQFSGTGAYRDKPLAGAGVEERGMDLLNPRASGPGVLSRRAN